MDYRILNLVILPILLMTKPIQLLNTSTFVLYHCNQYLYFNHLKHFINGFLTISFNLINDIVL